MPHMSPGVKLALIGSGVVVCGLLLYSCADEFTGGSGGHTGHYGRSFFGPTWFGGGGGGSGGGGGGAPAAGVSARGGFGGGGASVGS